jgi:Cohesin domain/Secretion system C-terminal sorting domain
MTMLRWTLTIVMSFFFVNIAVTAQSPIDSAYISVPDVQAQQGNVLIIPIKLSTFDKFYGVQFSLQWDTTMLQYQGVSDFGLPQTTAGDNFGSVGTSAGKIGFLWYDKSSQSTGLAPVQNKNLFSIKLKVIGDNNKQTALTVSNDPAAVEVLNSKNLAMKISKKFGKISIGTVNTNDFNFIDTKLHDIYPNPLSSGNTKLQMDIAQATNVNIAFYDISGKNIFHINNFYNIGTHFVEIGKSQFPQAGIYTYSITTSFGESLSGKLLVN